MSLVAYLGPQEGSKRRQEQYEIEERRGEENKEGRDGKEAKEGGRGRRKRRLIDGDMVLAEVGIRDLFV